MKEQKAEGVAMTASFVFWLQGHGHCTGAPKPQLYE